MAGTVAKAVSAGRGVSEVRLKFAAADFGSREHVASNWRQVQTAGEVGSADVADEVRGAAHHELDAGTGQSDIAVRGSARTPTPR